MWSPFNGTCLLNWFLYLPVHTVAAFFFPKTRKIAPKIAVTGLHVHVVCLKSVYHVYSIYICISSEESIFSKWQRGSLVLLEIGCFCKNLYVAFNSTSYSMYRVCFVFRQWTKYILPPIVFNSAWLRVSRDIISCRGSIIELTANINPGGYGFV